MTIITIDIETIPAQDPAVLDGFRAAMSKNFKAPSTLTKEQAAIDLGITDKDRIKFTSKDSMISEWSERFKIEASEAAAQEQWRKTSFDGALGHVCVIGLAFNDEPPISIWSTNFYDREAGMLSEFFDMIDVRISEHPDVRPTFVGHNIIHFDLRFLFQRAVMLGVKPSRHIPFNARPWDDGVYDTMTRWAGANDRVKLDKLAKAMNIGSKGDIDGSMVWDYVRDGRIAEVANYCCNDVSMTRSIYKRMTFSESKTVEVCDDDGLPF